MNFPWTSKEKQESFPDIELPTIPASPQGRTIYDRDLYELVGKLIAVSAENNKRLKALSAQVRSLTRRQTASIGGLMVVIQGILEYWRMHH